MVKRIIKKGLVASGLDGAVAMLYHRLHNPIFGKLIPGPAYYQNQTRTVTRNGVRYRLQPSDLSQWFMFSDHNDNHVRAAIDNLPASTGLVLDIGANIGHFSLQLAKHIQKGKLDKKIIAFEPNPKVYTALMSNLHLNPSLLPFVTVHNIGVGETSGEMQLQIPKRNSGAGTLVDDYSKEPHDTFMVPIRPIDSLGLSRVQFIKIDVEGFEYFVFKGAIETIKRDRPTIYFETFAGQLQQTEIFALLKTLDYTFYLEKGSSFSAFDAENRHLLIGMSNILACP